MSQSAFTSALLDPALPVPDGLTDPRGRPAERRFNVYRNNVAASLIDALETGFPCLVTLLGRAYFRSLAGLFFRAHPPRSRILSQYGAEMPAFLDAFAPLAKYPYLADVARLELALRHSYHAADAAPLATDGLDPAALMEMTPRLAPATLVLSSPHPVLGIWRHAMQAGAPTPTPQAEDVLIARAGFDPEPHLLPRGGTALAGALDGRNTLGLALERTVEAMPGLDIAPLLSLFLGSGALTLSDEGDME